MACKLVMDVSAPKACDQLCLQSSTPRYSWFVCNVPLTMSTGYACHESSCTVVAVTGRPCTFCSNAYSENLSTYMHSKQTMQLNGQLHWVGKPGGRAWPKRTPVLWLTERARAAWGHGLTQKSAGNGGVSASGKAALNPGSMSVEDITAVASGLAMKDLERLQVNITNLICNARIPAYLAHLNIKFSTEDGGFECEVKGVKLTGWASEDSWKIAAGTIENRCQDFELGPLRVEAHSAINMQHYNKVEGLQELRAVLNMDYDCFDFPDFVLCVVSEMSTQVQLDVAKHVLKKAMQNE